MFSNDEPGDELFPENPRLRAAIGYFDLGMFEEAWAEFDDLDPEVADSVEAAKVKLVLLLREERWERALEVSRKLCDREPDEPAGFIHAAYCLHELGKTDAAQELLLEGPRSLRDEPVYYYNLACYHAALGKTTDAEVYLRKSFEMDEELRVIARKDPDLEALRDVL